jgi:hypothetical protein
MFVRQSSFYFQFYFDIHKTYNVINIIYMSCNLKMNNNTNTNTFWPKSNIGPPKHKAEVLTSHVWYLIVSVSCCDFPQHKRFTFAHLCTLWKTSDQKDHIEGNIIMNCAVFCCLRMKLVMCIQTAGNLLGSHNIWLWPEWMQHSTSKWVA